MVRQDIVEYIKKELAAGYDISTIRNYLMAQGHQPKTIDEAIDAVYKQPKKHELPKIKFVPVVILIGVLILFVAGIFLFRSLLTPPETGIKVGNQTTIVIPEENQPTQAEGAGQEEVPEETTPPITAPAETAPVSRATGMSLAVALDRLDVMSLSESRSLCNQFSGKDKDRCIRKVALTHGDSSLCDQITDAGIRDDCYINFAYIADFSVCEKIEDVYLQQSCRDLGKVQAINFENSTTPQ